MDEPTDEEKYLSRITYQVQRSLETATNQINQLAAILKNIENVDKKQIKYGLQNVQGFQEEINTTIESIKEEHLEEGED